MQRSDLNARISDCANHRDRTRAPCIGGTMNANRLIEEWRRQGRVLEVEGANTILWRMSQGETVICVHGVPTSGFLYRKLLPELASRGLEGVTVCTENLNTGVVVMKSAQDGA